MRFEKWIKDSNNDESHYSEWNKLSDGRWIDLEFNIPYMKGVCLEEVGVEFTTTESSHHEMIFYLDQMDFAGQPNYKVVFNHERIEKWNIFREIVSQFTHLRGLWTLEDGHLSGRYSGEPAECYTGDLKWKNYILESKVIPKLREDHRVLFRVQGGVRSYAVRLTSNHKVSLFKNNNGYEILLIANFNWEHENVYNIKIKVIENKIDISINDE